MNKIFLDLYTDKYGETIPRCLAEEIVHKFAVTDGSERKNGEKWTYEETTLAGEKLGLDFTKISKCEFYFMANSFYSDYIKEIKKKAYSEDFILDLTKAWFIDVDAKKNKTFNYIFYNFIANT